MLLPGQRLGGRMGEPRYEVVRHLGGGGFGEVYEVIDTVENDRKALKVLERLSAEDAALLLEREASAASKVAHPNTVRVFEFGTAEADDGALPYMVMEYVEAGDMRGRLEEQRQSGRHWGQAELLEMYRQLAEGLAAINQHLVHRDLKPENILLQGPTLKIADFGLAKHVEESTRTLSFKGWGTLAYMAPETWLGQSATPATDVYSMGIIWYELATLQRPFDAASYEEWKAQHIYAQIPHGCEVNAALNPRLDATIYKMMAKQPRDRCQTAAELLAELDSVASPPGAPGSALPQSLVDAARAKQDKLLEEESATKRRQAAEAQQETLVHYHMDQLFSRIDALVAELNKTLNVRPIESRVLVWGKVYSHGARHLVVEGVGVVRDAPDAVRAHGLIAAAHMVFGEGPQDKGGLNFILLRGEADVHPTWHVAEIRTSPMVRRQAAFQPFAHPGLPPLLHDLDMHWRNIMHVRTVSIRQFTEDEVIPYLVKLVE